MAADDTLPPVPAVGAAKVALDEALAGATVVEAVPHDVLDETATVVGGPAADATRVVAVPAIRARALRPAASAATGGQALAHPGEGGLPGPPVRELTPPAAAAVEPPRDVRPAPPRPAPPRPVKPAPAAAKPKRSLPRGGRIAIAIAGLLLLGLVAMSRGRDAKKDAPRLMTVHDDVVVHADDLRRRKEVRPEDFVDRRSGVRGPVAPPVQAARPASVADAPPPAPPIDDLAARRARRAKNPDDLHAGRATPTSTGRAKPAEAASSEGRTPLIMPSARGNAPASPPVALLKAGQKITVVLDSRVTLAGGSSPVVAVVPAGPHRGAQFLGVASQAQGRVALRFKALILPDGRELAVRAEARGDDGGFGIPVAGSGSLDEDGEESVEAEVAADTATDLATGAIGGVAGDVLRDYSRKKRRGPRVRRSRDAAHVTIEAGEQFELFILEASISKTQ